MGDIMYYNENMTEEKMLLGKEMDKAVHYVAKNILESGHNSKPILSHSFRVAELLYQFGYGKNIVIAAILHDLIEDTDVTYEQLKNDFGHEIANLVQAVSFDFQIKDYLKQTKDMFEKCINYGFDALIIKCSDLIQNIDFIQFVDDNKKRIELYKKYEIFLDISKKIIGNTEVYKILKDKYVSISITSN